MVLLSRIFVLCVVCRHEREKRNKNFLREKGIECNGEEEG